jgi:hypothetical protein
MQSSSVHVPCKSGSPHGVLGGVQFLAAGVIVAAGAVFEVCPIAGPAVSAMKAAIDIKNGYLIRLSDSLQERNYFFFKCP